MINKFHINDEKNAPIVAALLSPIFLLFWKNLRTLPIFVRFCLLLSNTFFSAMLLSIGFPFLGAYASTGLIVWFWYGTVWGYATANNLSGFLRRAITIYSTIVTFSLTALLCIVSIYTGKPRVLPLIGSLGAIYFLLTGVSTYRKLGRR